MSENQTENMEQPVSQIDLAAWAVVSEPIDSEAVARVKENAKALAADADAVEYDKMVEPRSVRRKRALPPIASWLVRGGIAAAIVGIVSATLLSPSSKSAAFAAALKKLDSVKIFSFDQLIHTEKFPDPVPTRMSISESGRTRSEVSGTVTICDTTGCARITLIPDNKTAIVQAPGVDHGLKLDGIKLDQLSLFKQLRKLDDETTRELGEREIDGVRAFGKEVIVGDLRFEIWVDSAAEELVLVEHFFPEDSPIEKVVSKNFSFDEQANESMFSFEVPEGYEINRVDDELLKEFALNPEQSVIELLRGYAELTDGKFPPTLDDWKPFVKVMTADGKTDLELAKPMGFVTAFLSSIRKVDYGYLGDGVSLAQDEQVMVFWYRKDGQLRAIYSDLTISDISEDDLPK